MPIRTDADGKVILRFNGGLNARSSELDIDPGECSDGKNFDLVWGRKTLQRRKPFDAVATAPNGAAIRGGAQLLKSDGTRSVLIQAGGIVYSWDGTSGSGGMTQVGVCSSASRLRGYIEGNSVKDGNVLIGDLNLATPVKQWNGTTFSTLTTNLGSDFYAKYISVQNERAIYANCKEGSTARSHLLVGSARDTFGTITTANRPSSSLGVGDAFFLPMPNLKPVNSLITGIGQEIIVGTYLGDFYRLTGVDSKDYALNEFYASISSEPDEGAAFVGNDILFSRHGAIDSMSGVERFGNIETDDISQWLRPLVENIESFTLVYNHRLKKLYAFPKGGGKVYVLHKSFIDEQHSHRLLGTIPQGQGLLSPWSVWDTDHGFAFNPTMVMRLKDPNDGLEYIYMGAADGTLYRLDAPSVGADPGSNDINCQRLSGVIRIPPARAYSLNGWVLHRQLFSHTITLKFEYGGEQLFDKTVTVTMDAASNAPVFGGSVYFGGSTYFNSSFNGGRLQRRKFSPPGVAENIQVRVTVDGAKDFFIEELGLQFKVSA